MIVYKNPFLFFARKEHVMTNGGGGKHGSKKSGKPATKKKAKAPAPKGWAEKAAQGQPAKS